MLNLDPAKALVILVVALIVLGPERLPKVARQMAGIWREFTKIRDQVTDEVRSALPDVDIPRIPNPRGAISGLLNGMTASGTSTSTSGAGTEDSNVSQTAAEGTVEASEPRVGRVPPNVVVHPTLGDVAFLPDDPSMN